MLIWPCSDWCPCPGIVLGHQNGRCSHTPVPCTKNVHKQPGKRNNYREIGGKFEVLASTAYKKVNTTEGHWRKPVQTSARAWARCPSTTAGASDRVPGTLPKLFLGYQQKAVFRLELVPGNQV